MRKLLFLVVIAILARGAPAYAQSDTAIEEARLRFNEGLKQADLGNHEAARLKFSQAWAVFKSAAVLYNLARSEQLTGHDVEALEHFKLFLRMGADPKVTDAQRQKAAENIVALQQKVGQIEVDVPRGARVAVDGRTLDDVPNEPVAVPPGHHVVEATFDGRIKSSAVDCTAGNVVRVKIVFEQNRVVIEPPRETDKKSSDRYVVSGVVGGLGLVAVGVGAGFGLASQSAKDEENAARRDGICVDAQSAACRNLEDARDDVDGKATISTLGYIAGGALLVGAVVTFLVWPTSSSSKSGWRVTPTGLGARF
jgi:hypothetical protein